MTTRIHPTAIVSPHAKLCDGVEVGPYAIIEGDASIGANTWIDGHARIHAGVSIGENCRVYHGAIVGHTSVDLKSERGDCRTAVGDRTVLREYVSISASSFNGGATVVGNDCLLMHWTNIAHDCVIGDSVIMANFATLGGHVEIAGPARIGAHAAFHQYVRVGRGAMVGACSKATQDVPPFVLAEGNPAYVRSLNLLGRATARNHPMADLSEESVSALKRVFRLLFRTEMNLAQAIEKARAEADDPCVARLLDFIAASKRGICRRNPGDIKDG